GLLEPPGPADRPTPASNQRRPSASLLLPSYGLPVRGWNVEVVYVVSRRICTNHATVCYYPFVWVCYTVLTNVQNMHVSVDICSNRASQEARLAPTRRAPKFRRSSCPRPRS